MVSESLASSSAVKVKSSIFQFEVDYLKTKDLSIGEYITFPTITASGYDWIPKYYPQGRNPENQGSHVSFFLYLETEAKDIVAGCSFEVLAETGKFVPIRRYKEHTFSDHYRRGGFEKFIARDEIEDLYLVNGILLISCNITVITEPRVVKNHHGGLCDDIKKFWARGEIFDVTFEVEGESIPAHRCILALRSPVFKAKLFGPMAEANMESIKINEMKAEVFKALLHFVYTDELVVNGSSDCKTFSDELLQGLFVAADRYDLEKLTLLCEEQLRKNLSVDTVVTTLQLADRHSRAWLKRKCLEFASDPKNFSQVVLTEKYVHIMAGYPSLLAELTEMVESLSHSAKK